MSILSQYNHILHNRESPPPFEQPRKTNDKCDVREEQIDLRDEPVTDHELPERPIRVAVDFNAANDDTVIVDWPKEVRKLGGAPRKEMSTATRHLSDIPGSAEEESDSNENNSAQQVSNRRNHEEVGEYDYDDPFIDDEEDFFMEQLLYRPEIEGYFAWRGPVPTVEVPDDELLRSTSSEEENNQTAEVEIVPMTVEPVEATASATVGAISQFKPDATNPTPSKKPKKQKLELDENGQPRPKKKKRVVESDTEPALPVNSLTETSGRPGTHASMDSFQSNEVKPKKPKKPLAELSPEVQAVKDKFKEAIATIEFKKGKYPAQAKEPLLAWAQDMIGVLNINDWETLLDDTNKLYWNHLRDIMPYQVSTLKKIVTKHYLGIVFVEKDGALRALYTEARTIAKTAYEISVKTWMDKLTKWKTAHPDLEINADGKLVQPESRSVDQAQPAILEVPQTVETGPTDYAAEGDAAVPTATPPKKNTPPSKRLLWSNDLRQLIYKIITAELDYLALKKQWKEAIDTPYPTIPVSPHLIEQSMLTETPIKTADLDLTSTDLVIRKGIYNHIMNVVFLPVGANEYVSTTEIGRQYNSIRTKEELKNPVLAQLNQLKKAAAASTSSTPKKERKPRPPKKDKPSSSLDASQPIESNAPIPTTVPPAAQSPAPVDADAKPQP